MCRNRAEIEIEMGEVEESVWSKKKKKNNVAGVEGEKRKARKVF